MAAASSQGQEIPARLLAGFEGYLQCDGLSSYDAIWQRRGLKQLSCFDHARRKFVEVQKAQPKDKAIKVSKTDIAFGKINALYRLERQIKDATPMEKYRQRQAIAVLLLTDLRCGWKSI